MNGFTDATESFKRRAALTAVDEIANGMVVGLGTGSTAVHALHEIGRRLADGRLRDIVGIPTSSAAMRTAREVGIPLAMLSDHPAIDVTIDGADEVDPNLDAIKGMGGALLWEKIVAQVTRRWIIVIDEQKKVKRLGTRSPLPVEVVRYGWTSQRDYLESLGARTELRCEEEGRPYVTDEGHYIIHCRFGAIQDPLELDRRLRARAGIVEHGMFLGLASAVFVAGQSGVEVLKPS